MIVDDDDDDSKTVEQLLVETFFSSRKTLRKSFRIYFRINIVLTTSSW